MINVELRIYSYIMVRNSLMDGVNEEATDGRQDKKPHIAALAVGCLASFFQTTLHVADQLRDVCGSNLTNDFRTDRTSQRERP
ncbi:hypothetical protein [Xanthobacter sediminis]